MAVELEPPIVNLLGRREPLDSRNTSGIRDHDLVTGSVRLGSHFTLNGLIPALEEVEHGDGLLHGSGHVRLSWMLRYASVEAYSSYVPLKSVSCPLSKCQTRVPTSSIRS